MGLEFGERHLDWVEVWTVGGQEQEPSSAFLQDRGSLFALVTGEVIQNDHVARLQHWGELGLHVGFEDPSVHGFVDNPRRRQAIAAQAGDEGLRSPMAEGCFGSHANTDASTPAQTRHLCRGAGLVEEDQPMDFLAHAWLAVVLPVLTRLAHVVALGLGCQECFF